MTRFASLSCFSLSSTTFSAPALNLAAELLTSGELLIRLL